MVTFLREGAPSDAFQEALRSSADYWVVYELVDGDGELVLTTTEEPSSLGKWTPSSIGTVSFDLSQTGVADHSMTVPEDSSDSRLTPLTDGHPFRDGLHRVRVSGGFRIGDEVLLHRMVTLEIDEGVNIRDSAGQRVELSCRTAIGRLDSAFSTTDIFAAGENAMDVAAAVIAPVYGDSSETGDQISAIASESTNFTLPRIEVAQGDNRLELVETIAEAVGFELAEDEFGNVQLRKVPTRQIPESAAARWVYGDEGIPVAQAVEQWSLIPPTAGVKLTGFSDDDDVEPPEITVLDRDPSSRAYSAPSSPQVGGIVEVDNELVISSQQALEAALAILRKIGRGARRLQLTANVNPALRHGDIVEFSSAELEIPSSLWLVESASIPTVPGSMAFTIASSWDPTGGQQVVGSDFHAPTDPPVTTFTDNFNRPDGNHDGETTDWTEIGYSHNLRGNRTVNLFGGDWCHVYVSTKPLEGADQFAQIEITDLDFTSDQIGPLVRSNGQGDGFALLASGANAVELWRFRDRAPAELLDSYQHGSSLVGAVMRLEIVDTALVGKLDGATVVDATSGANQGNRFAGICSRAAQGSPESPGADNFEMGTL